MSDDEAVGELVAQSEGRLLQGGALERGEGRDDIGERGGRGGFEQERFVEALPNVAGGAAAQQKLVGADEEDVGEITRLHLPGARAAHGKFLDAAVF